MNWLHTGFLFVVGAVAGFINVMAGGGSSITLPTLIFLGLDGATANGTNRIAIFIQNIFAILSFRRQQVNDARASLKLAVFTLPGAVLGALVAVRISDLWFQRILAVIMVGIVLSLFTSPPKQNAHTATTSTANPWIYPALLGIGFYGGFVQVGVGFLFMAALYHLLKLNLVYVNMHKVFIVFVYTLPALFIFIASGKVNWLYGLSLAAGNATGAWFSARAAVRGGEGVIRTVLAVAILLMAAKLFGTF